MAKKVVNVHVQGYGTVIIDRPTKYNRVSFADGVAQAVATTVGLVTDRDRTSFHPVLGAGGYDWDHETQTASVRETQSPGISYQEPRRLRFLVLWVSGNILGFARSVRDQLHKGGR